MRDAFEAAEGGLKHLAQHSPRERWRQLRQSARRDFFVAAVAHPPWPGAFARGLFERFFVFSRALRELREERNDLRVELLLKPRNKFVADLVAAEDGQAPQDYRSGGSSNLRGT